MKNQFIPVLLFFVPVLCFCQTVVVRDSDTLKPVAGVIIRSTDAATYTDENGRADLKSLSGNAFSFSHPSYFDVSVTRAELEKAAYVVHMRSRVFAGTVVITSASKREEEQSHVPARVISISSEERELQNPQTTADLLGASDEVFIQKSQLGGGSPMIRGFSANRVLIVVDGVRMNNAIFREGNLQNVIALDSNSLSSAEVIFGPGSVMYGSDAIGGVMAFNTLTPKTSDSDQPQTELGYLLRSSTANDEFTGHGRYYYSSKLWSLAGSISRSNFDDLRMGSEGRPEYKRLFYADRISGTDVVVENPDPNLQRFSGYDQTNVIQKINFTPDDRWNIGYSFHYSNTSDVPRYDRLIETRNNTLRYAEWYYGPQKWRMNSLHVDYSGGSRLFDVARITLAAQRFEESRNDRKFGDTILRERSEQVDAYSLNMDFDKELSVGKLLYYGIEIIRNTVGSTGVQTNIESGAKAPVASRYPDGSTWDSYAVYISLSSDVNSRTTVVAGGRYNTVDLDATFDRTFYPFPFQRMNIDTGALTGSLGLVYNATESVRLNLNTSSGFRAPNIDDVGKVFESEPGSVVVPNENLESEYIWNVDAGLTAYLADSIQLEFAGFYSVLDNAMVRRDFQFGGLEHIEYDGEMSRVQAVQNADSATVYGAQIALRGMLGRGLSFRTHHTFMFGEAEDGESLRHVPPPFGSFRIQYVSGPLQVEGYLLYNGEISPANLAPSERSKTHMYALDAGGQPFSPGWYTVNAKAVYRFHNGLHLNIGLENLLDRRYRPYSSGIVAPGRNLIVSVGGSF